MVTIELTTDPSVRPRLDHTAVENARLVREARDQLLEDEPTVTIALLARGRGADPNSVRQWVRRQRRGGRLVTVEHNGVVLVPTYQLDEAFDVRPTVADVTRRLVAAGMSPWAVWRWFTVTNGWIGEPPAAAARRGDRAALERARHGLLEA